jgi:GT2 family glycosyltransferase
MNFDLSISIVLSNSSRKALEKLLTSVAKCRLTYQVYIIDNSSFPALENDPVINGHFYIFNNENVGYGRGHNVALKRSIADSKYHLVLNPDVSFPEETLEQLFSFMENNPDVGLVLPKVFDPNSRLQYLARRLPDPADLILRRLNFRLLSNVFLRRLHRYEMREKDYGQMFHAGFLSGCFMFMRMDSIRKVGFFDERYFMYMEDVDLSRRIGRQYKNVYLPTVSIVHEHARGSYKSLRLLAIHTVSAIRYFNKWGWIWDLERKRINNSL